MEDKRSIHSLHSLRPSRYHPCTRPLSDISFVDEDFESAFNNIFTNFDNNLKNLTLTRYFSHSVIDSKDQGHVPFYRNESLVFKFPGSGVSGDRLKQIETLPLLAKEMTMERSRSAPFTSLQSAAGRFSQTTTVPAGPAMTNTQSLSSSAKICNLLKSNGNNKSTMIVSNPLVQGYHLLCETSI